MLELIRWAAVVAALLFSLIWLLAVVASVGAVVAWIPPSGMVAAAVAIALGSWPPPRPPAAS